MRAVSRAAAGEASSAAKAIFFIFFIFPGATAAPGDASIAASIARASHHPSPQPKSTTRGGGGAAGAGRAARDLRLFAAMRRRRGVSATSSLWIAIVLDSSRSSSPHPVSRVKKSSSARAMSALATFDASV